MLNVSRSQPKPLDSGVVECSTMIATLYPASFCAVTSQLIGLRYTMPVAYQAGVTNV